MTGTLASQLGHLTRLRELQISYCPSLRGSIPSQTGLLNLVILELEHNNITGTIPEELYSNIGLAGVLLNDNKLSGTISTRIGQLTALLDFRIEGNKLSGTLPEEILQLTKLKFLHIQRNKYLIGSIPTELCEKKIQRYEIVADCTPTAATGEPAVFCPPGCCTTCCDVDTKICLDQ